MAGSVRTVGGLLLAAFVGLGPSCSLRPPYVVLTVEDPGGYATTSTALAIGRSAAAELQPIARGQKPFPLTVTVTAKAIEEATVVVEARDADNVVVARGAALVPFKKDGTPAATIRLGRPCDSDATCDDGLYCNGTEACIDGSCQAQTPPCGTSFACVVSECIELMGGQGECKVSVDHAACASAPEQPYYCNTTAGCVPGHPCLTASDCDDGLVCNGAELCVDFHCEGGTPLAIEDGDPCTTDGCNDARLLQGLAAVFHVSDPHNDGNQCDLPSGNRGICRAAVAGCAEPDCGDGIITASNSEACDDGNGTSGDGCDNNCQLEPGWSCAGQPTACTSICGDQIVVGQEECDTGSNSDPCDGCRSNCTLVTNFGCGDGYVCGSEACDLGALENDGSYSGCEADCSLSPYCGDGAVDAADGETCDDGGLVSLDGCSATCAEEAGWSCTGAPSTCTSVCGDYIVRGSEACDQGPSGNLCANCTASCTTIAGFGCGDANVCGSEQCDLGATANTGAYNGCNADCTRAPACGDGIVQGGFSEACDNGVLNSTSPGARCSTTCQHQYWVSGIQSGLSGHGSIGLRLNSGSTLALSADGLFTLPTPLASGASYSVSIVSTALAPTGVCQLKKASGVIVGSSVASVLSECFATRSQMSAAGYHTCVRLAGRVRCWGKNWGNLGVGDTESRGDEPGEMGDALPVVSLGTGRTATYIAAGPERTCAILDNGQLKCWGQNDAGTLGLGHAIPKGIFPSDMGDNLPPVDLGSGRTAVSLGLGSSLSCARLDNGAAKCWGDNIFGQLGLGDMFTRGESSGQMGDNLPAIQLGTGRTVLQIAAGEFHACARLDNGSVKCWGFYRSIGLGGFNSRGDQGGEMGDALPAVDLGTGKTAVDIAAGDRHNCARLNDASVKCWGDNSHGQLGLGDKTLRGGANMGDALPALQFGTGRTAVQLALGAYHSCARLDDGSVKCWGLSQNGTLGAPSEDRGDDPNEMGNNLPTVDLGTSRTAVDISAGSYHTCARLDNGHVKCWGDNNHGELGLGDRKRRGNGANEMGDYLLGVNTGW